MPENNGYWAVVQSVFRSLFNSDPNPTPPPPPPPPPPEDPPQKTGADYGHNGVGTGSLPENAGSKLNVIGRRKWEFSDVAPYLALDIIIKYTAAVAAAEAASAPTTTLVTISSGPAAPATGTAAVLLVAVLAIGALLATGANAPAEAAGKLRDKDPLGSQSTNPDGSTNHNPSPQFQGNPNYADPSKPDYGDPKSRPNAGAAAQDGGAQELSPLILDLDGDGIETIGVKDSIAFFDHDNNGFAELTGWVADNDGLLFWDRNSNGLLDGGNEIFGDNTTLANGQKAANGFAALTELDTNADGKIDAADTQWAQLGVVTGTGNVKTLAEANVQSLNLAHTEQNEIKATGNLEWLKGSYTTTTGQTRSLTDVLFQINGLLTVKSSYLAVDATIAALPDVQGYGNVADLHQAMAANAALVTLVQQLAAATSVETQQQLFDTMLYQWVGVTAVDPASRGQWIDARQLAVVETFNAKPFRMEIDNSPNPQQLAAEDLKYAYSLIKANAFIQFARQTTLKAIFDDITVATNTVPDVTLYNVSVLQNRIVALANTDTKAALDLAFKSMYAIHQTNLVASVQGYAGFINTVSSLGKPFAHIMNLSWDTDFRYGSSTVDNLSVSIGDYAQDRVFLLNDGNDSISGSVAEDNVVFGGAGNDTFNTGAGHDLLIGGTGNDTMTGGEGNDLFVFNLGDGQDTINSTSRAGIDRIVFGSGITAGMVTLTNISTKDTRINLSGTADSILIKNQRDTASNTIHYLEFADGTIQQIGTFLPLTETVNLTSANDNITDATRRDINVTYNTLAGDDRVVALLYGNNTFNGGDGNDRMYSGYGDDTLYGDAGDDFLDGKHGDDLLVGGAGHDELHGGLGNDLMTGGTGNDQFLDLYGDDRYVFNLGDGADVITDMDGRDTLSFGSGITSTDLRFYRRGSDLRIDIQGTTDNITIDNYYQPIGINSENNREQEIETLQFSDGSILTTDNIAQQLVTLGTSGMDFPLYGTKHNDVIDVLAGNDQVRAGAGNDTVYGGEGNDDLRGEDGLDSLYGGAGNDNLYGDLSAAGSKVAADLLAGGTGNDSLYGGGGSDTYLFNKNDGLDIVSDTSGSNDVLKLGENVDIALWFNGNDLQLGFKSVAGDIATLQNQRLAANQVERLERQDGQFLTANDVNLVIQQMTAYATSNSISLTSLNDVRNNDNLLQLVATAWHN